MASTQTPPSVLDDRVPVPYFPYSVPRSEVSSPEMLGHWAQIGCDRFLDPLTRETVKRLARPREMPAVR